MSEGDRSKSQRLTANERVNAISRAFMNLGTALLAAAAARIYVNGDIDGTAVFWLSCVIGLMFACVIGLMFGGMKILDLLDAE